MSNLVKRILACTMALGLCAAVAGCGGDQAKPKGEVSQKIMNSQTKQEYVPVTEIKEGNKTVYALVKKTKGSYWETVIKGMTDAAKAEGVNLYVGGSGKDGNWEKQKQMLTVMRGTKHDAIVLAPTDSTQMASVCKVMYTEKKKLYLVDTLVNSKDFAAAYLSNNADAGRQAAEKLIELMKANGVKESDKAAVVIGLNSIGGSAVDDRLASAISTWNAKAPKAWKMDAKYMVNYDDKEMAKKLLADKLKGNNSIKGVLTLNNGTTGASVETLLKENRKDVALVGFDMNAQTEQGLANKDFKIASVIQNQYKMGYEAVKAAAAAAKGGEVTQAKIIDTGIKVVDNSNYKK